MEPTDSAWPKFQLPKSLADAMRLFRRDADTPPSPMAVWLAATLADRLESVMPAPFHARAESGWVSYFNGAEWDGSSDIGGVLDQDSAAAEASSEPNEFQALHRVASICWNVLSSAQDMISETTSDPWPRLPGGGMANPGTRRDGERVYLWYGPDADSDESAVLSLPPIDLGAWAGRQKD